MNFYCTTLRENSQQCSWADPTLQAHNKTEWFSNPYRKETKKDQGVRVVGYGKEKDQGIRAIGHENKAEQYWGACVIMLQHKLPYKTHNTTDVT